MNRLLIATSNPAKLDELRRFLSDLPLTLVGLTDIGITRVAPETETTFAENARMKAVYYQRVSGLPSLADDGGLEIAALQGEPGVASHRWIDGKTESTDAELIAYAMQRLIDVPEGQRQAQLRLVLALAVSATEVYTAEASVQGIIPLKPSPRITAGFPYRSLLYLPEIGKFYDRAELTPEEMETYNHRQRAVAQLKQILRRKLC